MSTSRDGRATRDQYHHGDLRNALIDAGRTVAREVGEEALTLREVARRAGVSHTAAYKHFGSKLDLLRAIAVLAFVEFTEVLRSAATTNDLETLERLAAAYVRFGAEHPVEFGFMFNRELCQPPGEEDALKEASLAAQDILRRLLADLQQAGLVREEDLEAQLLTVWSHVHGFTTILLRAPGFDGIPLDVAEELARDGMRRTLTGLAV